MLDAAKVTERVELAAYFLALHSVYYADADVATAKGVVATKEAAVATAVGSWNDEDEEACTGLVAAQKAMDGFEPEMEDAPEPEEGEQAEPTLVNAEEKATLEAALAEEQAKVDAANMDVAAATAALEAAVAAAADCAVNVASERAALLADAEALQVLAFDKATADLAGLEMYCMTMHDNFYLLDGSKSKWWLYAKAAEISLENVKRRQLYLVDSAMGNPAPLYDLGVTPIELASRVGAAGLHCPVSLAKNKLLIDCSLKLDIAADYKGTVYGFASANALNTFIDAPSPFLSVSTQAAAPTPISKSIMELDCSLFPAHHTLTPGEISDIQVACCSRCRSSCRASLAAWRCCRSGAGWVSRLPSRDAARSRSPPAPLPTRLSSRVRTCAWSSTTARPTA